MRVPFGRRARQMLTKKNIRQVHTAKESDRERFCRYCSSVAADELIKQGKISSGQ